jgi:hypothetical protein
VILKPKTVNANKTFKNTIKTACNLTWSFVVSMFGISSSKMISVLLDSVSGAVAKFNLVLTTNTSYICNIIGAEAGNGNLDLNCRGFGNQFSFNVKSQVRVTGSFNVLGNILNTISALQIAIPGYVPGFLHLGPVQFSLINPVNKFNTIKIYKNNQSL